MVNRQMVNKKYPLYDVPYLVRDPNDFGMSYDKWRRHKACQNMVDTYFTERIARQANAQVARQRTAQRHRTTIHEVIKALKWYYNQCFQRGKFTFLINFPPSEEQI